MKQHFLKLFFFMAMVNTGCSAQKNLIEQNINSTGSQQTIDDAELKKLQTENDLVIAFAVENFAWVKSIDYFIIAKNNNGWKGYKYHCNLMQGNAASPTSIHSQDVNSTDCDAVVKYISDNEGWNIKGDSGNGFCSDGNKNCNINDAPGSRLWMITKAAYINPSYYAPQFFEKCCPEKQRGIFLSITQKIAGIFGEKENE
ncbi:MAG: hypothetical protein JST21_02170 [Bacteroidetes bacterium]|nr:hypothetical protein [Bacteroidota bacterium]